MQEQETKKKDTIIYIKNPKEIQTLLHFFNDVYSPPLSDRVSDPNLYADKLYRSAYVYAVCDEGTYLGFIAFYANNYETKTAYLSQIAVNPKNQNKGIGFLLLELCSEISKQKGMKTLKLEVFKNNVKAVNFYMRNGFEVCGEASADSVYMMKKL